MIILDEIVDYLKRRDMAHVQGIFIVMYDYTEKEVRKGLTYGLESGVLKRLKSNKGEYWCLIPKKVSRIHKKKFTRPNYGIGRALAKYINSQERDTIFTLDKILEHLQHQFPSLTIDAIDREIKRWISQKRPGIEKIEYLFGPQSAYIFRKDIKL